MCCGRKVMLVHMCEDVKKYAFHFDVFLSRRSRWKCFTADYVASWFILPHRRAMCDWSLRKFCSELLPRIEEAYDYVWIEIFINRRSYSGVEQQWVFVKIHSFARPTLPQIAHLWVHFKIIWVPLKKIFLIKTSQYCMNWSNAASGNMSCDEHEHYSSGWDLVKRRMKCLWNPLNAMHALVFILTRELLWASQKDRSQLSEWNCMRFKKWRHEIFEEMAQNRLT